ncbi:hypothetical protein ACA910_003022 [Epithemia clementina (nom. ined.)]
MTVVDCHNALRFHVTRYRNQSVAKFANRLAWDLTNNKEPGSSSKRGVGGTMPRNGFRQDVLPSQTRSTNQARRDYDNEEEEDDVLLRHMARLQISEHGGCSGGRGAGISNYRYPRPHHHNSIEELLDEDEEGMEVGLDGGLLSYHHDHIPNPDKSSDGSGRSTNRRCKVCQKNTRWLCSHLSCHRIFRVVDGRRINGTPICPVAAGVRPNFRELCIDVHRRAQKKVELLSSC